MRDRRDRFRAIPLNEFAPLAEIEGVTLVSLQQGDVDASDVRAAIAPLDLGPELDARDGRFIDALAVMRNLDLLVTADTAIAHLAGASGVPVCLATSKLSEWRWLLDREDTPWYPTMRLYRQRTLGDWPEVFRRIATDVRGQLEILRG